MRTWCVVEFIRSPRGHALGKCDCPAGEKGWYCYHLAAALTVHIGLVRHGLRKPISRSIWTQISDEFWQEGLAEIDECADYAAPSMLLESFDSGNFSLLADFSFTSKFYLDKHRAVCFLWERKFCFAAKAAHPIGFARASLLKRQTSN